MKATWGADYDYRTDKMFKRPCCPACYVPIEKEEDGKYRCFSCNEVVEVTDPEMVKWFADREGEKVEMRDCIFGCGGKGTVEAHLYKNDVTLEWKFSWSVCSKCGARIMV